MKMLTLTSVTEMLLVCSNCSNFKAEDEKLESNFFNSLWKIQIKLLITLQYYTAANFDFKSKLHTHFFFIIIIEKLILFYL